MNHRIAADGLLAVRVRGLAHDPTVGPGDPRLGGQLAGGSVRLAHVGASDVERGHHTALHGGVVWWATTPGPVEGR